MSVHQPRKRFGQHFLHDVGIIHGIVAAVNPQPGEHLVEIGPGEGAITLPLLRVAKRMTVIELDRDLVPRIKASAESVGELEVIQADVLKIDLKQLAGERALRIVGNLPYNISSPILFHCIHQLDAIADMHFMLQKEVVDRMAAEPGSKVYGRLSVMLQLACVVEPLFDVPPTAFRPPPKVDSAIVRLIPRPASERPSALMPTISCVVRAAFGQRRKTLSNALNGVATPDQLRAAGIYPGDRAERLSPASYVRLAEVLGQTPTVD